MRLQGSSTFGRRQKSGCVSFVFLLVVLAGGALVLRQRWLPLLQLGGLPLTPAALSDAQAALARGDLTLTIALTERLLNANARDNAALSLLVRALIYRSDSDFGREADRTRALALTTDALNRSLSPRDVIAIHAYALQANGQNDDARRYALRAIDRDSNDIVARLALALAYSSGGLFEAGLREADKAVSLAQQNTLYAWDAGRVRAFALSRLGRYRDALTAADLAINYQRSLLPLHFEKALYALQISNFSLATSAYFNVLAFDGNNVKARYRLCELSSNMREAEAAVAYCTQVTERAPELADGWYLLGKEYYLQGQWRAAQQALNRCTTLEVKQALPIEERRFECWYLQGQSAEILGDCPNLLATYRQFQQMERVADLPETWIYPPEGPAICLSLTPSPLP